MEPAGIPIKHITLFFLCIIMCFTLNSCGLAVNGIVETARGGYNDFLVIEQIHDLSPYQDLVIEPFTSAIGGRVNTKLLNQLNAKIADFKALNNPDRQSGRQLQLSGRILHLTGVSEIASS